MTDAWPWDYVTQEDNTVEVIDETEEGDEGSNPLERGPKSKR